MNEKQLISIEFNLEENNLISVSLVKFGNGFLAKNNISGAGQPLSGSADIAKIGGDFGNCIITALNNAFPQLGENEGVTLQIQLHRGANIVQSAFGATEPQGPAAYAMRVITTAFGLTPKYTADEKGMNNLFNDIKSSFLNPEQAAFQGPFNMQPGGKGHLVDVKKTNKGSTELT